MSLNFEYRFASIGAGHGLHTVTAAVGMHF
jgi:hypothetical protein